MHDDIDPYDLGWSQGYNDQIADCPFAKYSEEYNEFWEGYTQGCMDC